MTLVDRRLEDRPQLLGQAFAAAPQPRDQAARVEPRQRQRRALGARRQIELSPRHRLRLLLDLGAAGGDRMKVDVDLLDVDELLTRERRDLVRGVVRGADQLGDPLEDLAAGVGVLAALGRLLPRDRGARRRPRPSGTGCGSPSLGSGTSAKRSPRRACRPHRRRRRSRVRARRLAPPRSRRSAPAASSGSAIRWMISENCSMLASSLVASVSTSSCTRTTRSLIWRIASISGPSTSRPRALSTESCSSRSADCAGRLGGLRRSLAQRARAERSAPRAGRAGAACCR